MKPALLLFLVSAVALSLILLSCQPGARPDSQTKDTPGAFLGFDRNIYPGDEAMKSMRHDFAFSGYWLGPPPGEKTNTWLGKRELLRSQGFGFLLLYRGRESRELKAEADAVQKGILDARNAAAAAKSEGFAPQSIIFLDIEEGGRLPATYHSYLRAWTAELTRAGYRSGAYCSGIPVNEGPEGTITTADDIRAHAPSQDFVFFVFNDVCPPSPGCTFMQNPPSPAVSGTPYSAIWQYGQSPRRKERTALCPSGYNTDGNCYALSDAAHKWFLDVSSASTADPSGGAK